jgi:hypothetical protein
MSGAKIKLSGKKKKKDLEQAAKAFKELPVFIVEGERPQLRFLKQAYMGI